MTDQFTGCAICRDMGHDTGSHDVAMAFYPEDDYDSWNNDQQRQHDEMCAAMEREAEERYALAFNASDDLGL